MSTHPRPPLLLLCDFDGTLIEQDVTNLIWDRYSDLDWRTKLIPPWRAGELSHLGIMVEGYKGVSTPEAELVAFVQKEAQPRAGFASLKACCDARGWPLAVVSGGLEFYVRALVDPSVPYYCYAAELKQHWEVRLPSGVGIADDDDYKLHVLQELKKAHPGCRSVFIGDGRNDLGIAGAADYVFAVKDSILARLCREARIACAEFMDFREVAAACEKLE